MADRVVIHVVTSPLPHLYPDVQIYDSTLQHMRESGHHQEVERIAEVYQTIASPDFVHRSKTNARAVVLVSSTSTSTGGSPLRVPVKVVSPTEAIMASAYFSNSTDHGELIWSKSGGPVK